MEINPRWLNLDQANKYCPIGRKKLIQLIQDGKIQGGRQSDNQKHPWFVDRISLDDYMQSMINFTEAKKKAIENMERIM
ncbi:MAG: hypothetical protein SWH54_01325 [Thermodesulfobacteriota bacterium]|nr:hypothetical protein [Thermodesulfobacteriota bacterium]